MPAALGFEKSEQGLNFHIKIVGLSRRRSAGSSPRRSPPFHAICPPVARGSHSSPAPAIFRAGDEAIVALLPLLLNHTRAGRQVAMASSRLSLRRWRPSRDRSRAPRFLQPIKTGSLISSVPQWRVSSKNFSRSSAPSSGCLRRALEVGNGAPQHTPVLERDRDIRRQRRGEDPLAMVMVTCSASERICASCSALSFSSNERGSWGSRTVGECDAEWHAVLRQHECRRGEGDVVDPRQSLSLAGDIGSPRRSAAA